jgi:WhiB family transcriptional regulator, redox-sensing transcriptional regulator
VTFLEVEALMLGHDLPLLAELVNRPAWMADAACRGSGLDWFPGRGEDTRPLKALCASCTVRGECLDFGLQPVHGAPAVGIWGGTSARERRPLRAAAVRSRAA